MSGIMSRLDKVFISFDLLNNEDRSVLNNRGLHQPTVIILQVIFSLKMAYFYPLVRVRM